MKTVRSVALVFVLGIAFTFSGASAQTQQCSCCSEMAMYKSMPQWNCGNPPTTVPKREDINTGNEIEDMKRFHMAVSNFRARSYTWMVCTTNFIHKYPKAVDHWGRSLIKKHEVVQ